MNLDLLTENWTLNFDLKAEGKWTEWVFEQENMRWEAVEKEVATVLKEMKETKQDKEDSEKETNYLPIILIIGAVAGFIVYKKYIKK